VTGKTAEILRNVQCEGCHGPGSEYKFLHGEDKAAALLVGMLEPTEKVCAVCHTPVLPKDCWGTAASSPAFRFSERVERITHARPPKKP
jgi:hypothetical protein